MTKLFFLLSEITVEGSEDVFAAIKKLSDISNLLSLPRQSYLRILLALSEVTNCARSESVKSDSIRSDSINKIKYVLKKDNDYNYLTIIIESLPATEGIAFNESLHSNQYGMIDIVNVVNVLVDCLSIEHPYPGSVNYSLDVKINNDLDVNQDVVDEWKLALSVDEPVDPGFIEESTRQIKDLSYILDLYKIKESECRNLRKSPDLLNGDGRKKKSGMPGIYDGIGKIGEIGGIGKIDSFKPALALETFAMEPFVQELIEREHTNESFKRIKRIFTMLSAINHAIIITQDKNKIFRETCRIGVEFGGFRLVWIGIIDNESGALIPIAYSGSGIDYLDNVKINIQDDLMEGCEPSGLSIRSGNYVVVNDIETSPLMGPWKEEALKRQFRSSVLFPLKSMDKVYGAIGFYSEEKDCFNDEEANILSQISSDISYAVEALERKKMHQMADTQIKRLSAVIEQSPVMVMIIGIDKRIEYANFEFTKISGYGLEEIIGKDIDFLMPDNLEHKNYEKLWQNVVKGINWSGELFNRKKDGNKIWVYATVSPIRDTSGDIINYLIISEDLTAKRNLEEQLRQSQKMEAIGKLAGGVAHDFNNILFAISNYLFLLRQEIDKENRLKVYVDGIQTSVERATHLTQSLLAFSRKQIVQPILVNLNSIIENMKKILLRLISEDIEIKFILAEKELMILADVTQVEQVLLNLVTNARDSMPNGGILVIATEFKEIDKSFLIEHKYGEAGRYALLTVSDVGCGIRKEIIDKIFDPFFTTKAIGEGTGLGLSTVYGIIRQNNGDLKVYSEPEIGTTFKIYLPLSNESGGLEEPIGSSVQIRGGVENILLAEDDENVRITVSKILKRYGYKVFESIDGEDAVIKFKMHKDEIDLIILDVIMPKKNGKQVYNEVMNINQNIKVIFLSGYSQEIISHKGIIDDGLQFMEKPAHPNELLLKVRQVLDS